MYATYKEWITLPRTSKQKRVQLKSYQNTHFLAVAEKNDDLSPQDFASRQYHFIEALTIDVKYLTSIVSPSRTASPTAASNRELLQSTTFSYQFLESSNENSFRIICDQDFWSV